LLDREAVLRSDIVANSTMNRSRGLAGVNSYAKDLRFDILTWLVERHRAKGGVTWYDVCCGEGRALIQAAAGLADLGLSNARLIGVDLVPVFAETRSGVSLQAGDAAQFAPEPPPDLITCVHGIHYIGDKLGLLAHLAGLLASDGILVANLDPQNVRIADTAKPGWAAIARAAGPARSQPSYKDHILRISGGGRLAFDVAYRGASRSETPNYTGITVMDSWYERDSA